MRRITKIYITKKENILLESLLQFHDKNNEENDIKTIKNDNNINNENNNQEKNDDE